MVTKIAKKKNAEKPCYALKYCPYGELVEQFPVDGGKQTCELFGHDCPVFYMAEVYEKDGKEIKATMG